MGSWAKFTIPILASILILGSTIIAQSANAESPTIKITKNATNANGAFSFTISNATNPSNSTLVSIPNTAINNMTVPLAVIPGNYSVTEIVPAGWTLDASDCEKNGISLGTILNFNATIGDFIECIFENTKLPGAPTIKITKNATNADGAFSFTISNATNPSNSTLVSIPNTAINNMTVPLAVIPGNYSVTEIVPAGWTLDASDCEKNGISLGTILNFNATIGDAIECIFENMLNPTTLTIHKNSTALTGTFDFDIQNSTGAETLGITTQFQFGSDALGIIGPIDIVPDTYSISEIIPSNWNLESSDCTINDVSVGTVGFLVNPGDSVLCLFNNTRSDATGEIHGIKLQDGIPLSGVKINMTNNDGTVTRETVTDSNGEYWFMDLIPDSYTVSEVLPDFSVQTFPPNNQPHIVSLDLDQIITGLDFQNEFVGPSQINGTIFQDVAPVGIFDASDTGFSNAFVRLAKFTPSSPFPQFVDFTFTDADGKYGFKNLNPGTYEIQSFPSVSPRIQSVPINGLPLTVNLSGQTELDVNMGFVSDFATVRGTTFIDSNENGIHDVNNPPSPDEPTARFNQVCASPGNICAFSNSVGDYELKLPPGTFEIHAGQFTSTGFPTLTSVTVPSLLLGDVVNDIDIPYRDLIPLPEDMDVPNSNGEQNGVPTTLPFIDLVITKNITVCTPVESPLVTVTFGDGTVLEQLMQNTQGTEWSVNFGSNVGRGAANVRVDIDCPADTIGYPDDISLIGPEDAFQIGDILFVDPSGQILNQCSGEPINGAIVTLKTAIPQGTTNFVIPQTSTHLPSENPQITGDDGKYAWLATPGDYTVTATKVGFVTTTSSIVTIPPPVTGLDIVLTPIDGCSIPLQQQKELIVGDLNSLLPTGDKKSDKEIGKAIKSVTKSTDEKFWNDDGNSLDDKKSKKVFDEEKKAVKSLMKAQKRGDVDVSSIILDLVGIDRQLASDVIDQIPDDVTGKSKKEKDKAVAELAKGDDKAGEGKFDKAIDHYKKAWKHAQMALKHDVDDDDDDENGRSHDDDDDDEKEHDKKDKKHDDDDDEDEDD